MNRHGLAATVASLLTTLSLGAAQRLPADVRPAWQAWEAGDIERADTLARQALKARSSDEARHLLFLTAYVRGAYRDALTYYHALSESYRRLDELTDTVIEAHIHLGALTEAVAFAERRKDLPAVTLRRLRDHLERPFQIELAGVASLTFTADDLSPYFPGLAARVNDRSVTVRLDTGGTYLHMGPGRAAALGIQTVAVGKDRAHLNKATVDAAYGIADRVVLGDLVLRNVPVDVLSSLTGDHDFVVAGTNLLESFLSTFDYPKQRLLLSQRGQPSAEAAHRALLPANASVVPFYLWADHFMFARGGLGARQDLNFFVDSGLVFLREDGRQASFTTSKRRLRELGVPSRPDRGGFFDFSGTLTLGPLREERPLLIVGAAGEQTFGGVRIHGLISHAFLKRYAWTIDFDARQYRFGHASGEPLS